MAATRRTPGDRKVPKTYRLSPAKVAAAQRILGIPTATEITAQFEFVAPWPSPRG